MKKTKIPWPNFNKKNKLWIALMFFWYDIDVNLEDIKSPLPPRKVILNTEVENENIDPRVSLNEQEIKVESNIQNQPPVQIEKKKGSNKVFLFVFIGIILAICIVLYLTLFRTNSINNQVVLKYWGLWEEENVINGIIADFESKNPNIKVDYKKNQLTGYAGRLNGRLAKSGETDDVPDVFRIHNTWIPMFRDNLAPVPKESVIKIGLETDFFDVYKKDLIEGGEYLSVPLMYDGLVMFYNPELLNKVQAAVPNNWWDLKKTAVKVTERDESGKIKIAGAAIGVVENVDHWSDIVGLMMKQNGVNLNTMSADNEKKMKDVLDFYTLFKTSDQVWDESLPNSTQYFASGNLAFYFGPSWRVFDIQALNPNLKFEIAGMPQLPTTASTPTDKIGAEAELTNIHWSTYWTEGVNNKSKHQKEAWKFLEYLSSPEVLEKTYQADSLLRSFGQIYPRKSMAEKISSNLKIKAFIDTANNASSWYLASETGDDGVNTEMQKYFKDAINGILAGSKNSTDAVKTLLSGVSQLRQKYGLIK
ncbi:MAG: extracellular solute-binding protein [Candidatus Shapirobacteria bacterium]|nr:extracellular solute-binding protein [Candidatus Shapirobacteria bacterium]